MTKSKFNLIPLNYKLALIAVVPIAVLIFFFYKIEKEQEEKITTVQIFDQKLRFSNAISTLKYQLVMERRYSLGKLFDKNSTNKLMEQRLISDRAIQDLDGFVRTKELDTAYKKYTFLDSLVYWREKVDHGNMSYGHIFSSYQKVNDRLDFFSSSNYVLSNKDLDEMMRLSHLLSYASGYLASLRLAIYFHLIAPSENLVSFSDYNLNYDLLQSYLKEIDALTEQPDFQQYNAGIFSNNNVSSTLRQLNEVYQRQRVESDYNAESWWISSAAAVDELKNVQQELISSVSDGIEEIKAEELKKVQNNRLLLMACLAAVVVLLFYILRNISDHLYKLQLVASKIAIGHTDIEFPNFARDYIGKLAIAMKKVDERNREMAKAASALGNNNYGVPIIAKGKHDVLGTAMQRMKQSLYEHYLNDQREMWLHGGKERINTVLIASSTLEEFGIKMLEAMADYLDAGAGAFYLLRQDGDISVMANLGVNDPQHRIKGLLQGNSLIGRAYVSKKVNLYEQQQAGQGDTLQLQSGTSFMEARWILVVPIVHDDEVMAILELAGVGKAQKFALDLVEQVHHNISSVLTEITSRMRLKELLKETQAQTEELQAQHAELESLNVELEAQANKLQASEEELRVQQAELMENNRQLEFHSRSLEEKNQIIIERNMDIRQKAEALERSTRYKSEFLANMSHELRTPLNSILLLSRLLTENHEGKLGQEQIEYANVIMNSGNSLLSLIDEILDLSKIESGKMTTECEDVEIGGLVSDMKALFLPIAGEKGIDLTFSIADKVPSSINTDNLRLQQILRNLISNAVKFTAKGGVTVMVEPHPEYENKINFKVRDTGIGIPLDKQQLVFEAFQQADGSTRRKYGGTGLGLSISRELAKLLGGHLFINSEVTDGAEFVLTMPLSGNEDKEAAASMAKLLNSDNVRPLPEAREPEIKAVDASSVSDRIKIRPVKDIPAELHDDREEIGPEDKVILIIEDDTNFAKVLVDFSRRNGYKVLTTVRGDLGIELARQYLPLAVLLDIELPVKNGWQVMEEIKSDPRTRHIPVHIMSSHEVKRESMSQGAIDFIRKPMALDQIAEVFQKIEEALNAGPRKVLILEENLKHAQALANYLQSYGVKTEIGQTIQSSINALKNHEVDCVVLDMGLPDASAYKTLEAIKADAEMENLPVIIFTGKNISQSEEKRIKQYADSIVIKTAHSYERILDEVGLFLHLIEHNRIDAGFNAGNRLVLDNALNGKTVLIADDDIRNIFSLTKVLEGYRMNVLVANDGKEAIDILNVSGNNVDVVLMDMMMPEMDGYETIALIRKDARFGKLPILSVTAKAMTGDREKCIAVGASDYISKPVDTDQLVSLLRVWLYK